MAGPANAPDDPSQTGRGLSDRLSFIKALRLTDFRSYSALDLNFDGRPVVLFGPNGAGKTNLLEAISLLSPGRGLRRAKADLLARKAGELSASAWGINAALSPDDIRLSVGSIPGAPRRKVVRIDGQTVPATHLADCLSVQWLTPAQDRLFTGPESDRRRFLDRLVLAFHPDHAPLSSRYEKARTERNRLLSDGAQDALWYDALERTLATTGAAIAKRRVMTVERLQDTLKARDGGAFPQADLRLTGDLEDAVIAGMAEDDLIEHSLRTLSQMRMRDMRAGRTLSGPHRSEVHVTHREKDMPAALCSTGEQKALLIGLVLAHARAQSGRRPTLLLDEVAAHLDATRRKALADELIDLGLQVFLTGTDQALFSDFGNRAQHLQVTGEGITAAG